jgi:hypothetical protein
MRGAEFAVGIAQCPRDVFLKRGWRLHCRHGLPDRETPGRIGEWFGGGTSYRSSRRQAAGDGYAAAGKQCAAIDEAVSGDEIEHGRAVPASPLAHAFLLNGWRDTPTLRNIVL